MVIMMIAWFNCMFGQRRIANLMSGMAAMEGDEVGTVDRWLLVV